MNINEFLTIISNYAKQSAELRYFLLFGAILFVPKILMRVRIPSAITALGIGVLTTVLLGWFEDDQLVLMLSRLGITSLFLYAGMEVNLGSLRKDSKVLGIGIGQGLVIIFTIAVIIQTVFDLNFQAALLISLGIMTPSTGFILNSLREFELSATEEYWIRSKAISAELVAIIVLFFALQTSSLFQFAVSFVSLVAMVAVLPLIFKLFLKRVAPHAPDSETTFLIFLALTCGVITTKLGTYYLVGAFIVGMTAGRFEHFMDKEKSNQINGALNLFFTFFVPFYFFSAGLKFSTTLFNWDGVTIAAIFLIVAIPIRILLVYSAIWFFLRDFWRDRIAISTSLLPTLIFGLVIATLLNDKGNVDDRFVSGLVIYALISSLLPALILRRAPVEDYNIRTVRLK